MDQLCLSGGRRATPPPLYQPRPVTYLVMVHRIRTAQGAALSGPTLYYARQCTRWNRPIMIQEMREKLSKEIDALSYELNVTLPQAIATAVELGDLRENSEYKAALERQQFVQARLGQLHQRLFQVQQLANTEAPLDRVGLGSRVTVLDLESGETDTYMLVLAEMMDIDAGHISLASPLGRALTDRKVGDEIALRLPTGTRKLRVTDLVTVHQTTAE